MPDSTQIHEYRNAAVFYFKEKKTDYKHGTAHKVYENKLQQDFYAPEINQKWCTDFTYLFLTNGSKRYNCTIIDLHDRSVVASITDKNMTADLAKRTLTKAIQSQPGINPGSCCYIAIREASIHQKSSLISAGNLELPKV